MRIVTLVFRAEGVVPHIFVTVPLVKALGEPQSSGQVQSLSSSYFNEAFITGKLLRTRCRNKACRRKVMEYIRQSEWEVNASVKMVSPEWSEKLAGCGGVSTPGRKRRQQTG